MRRNLRAFPLAAIALLAAGVAPPAPADVTLLRDVRRETTTFAERTLRTRGEERIRIRAGVVRIDDLMIGQSLIVRTDRRTVTHLNHLRKTVSTLSFDALTARRTAALDGVRGARAMAAATPDAARLDAILAGFGLFPAPPAVARRDTGETATLAGRKASRVRIEVDGKVRLDLWLGAEDPDAKAYVDALAALHAVPPAVAGALRRAPGLPLREESRYAWFLERVRVRAEAKSIGTEALPASAFEPPAGYRDAPFALLPDEAPPAPAATPPGDR